MHARLGLQSTEIMILQNQKSVFAKYHVVNKASVTVIQIDLIPAVAATVN